jgi:hypothetical protein
LAELEMELDQQVLAGGVHWEMSLAYHRLVLEMVLSVAILCTANNVPLPANVLPRVREMLSFTRHYLKPDGKSPLVRDADDGRLHRFEQTPFRDHRHILSLAGAFLGDKDLLSRAARTAADVVWMLGRQGTETAREMLRTKPAPLASRGFTEAGYYVLRIEDSVHIFVSCADIGMRGTYGGHAHNDCLSFELYCSGETLITDCGSYVYSADPCARNAFRSTASHNTVRVDRSEMNRMPEGTLFSMENDARPMTEHWESLPAFDFLRACHRGYERLRAPVRHRRDFYLDKRSRVLVIADALTGAGSHLFEVFFHFAPSAVIRPGTGGRYRVAVGQAVMELALQEHEGWAAHLENASVSERYGHREPASALVVSCTCPVPAMLTTVFDLAPANPAASDERIGAALAEYLQLSQKISGRHGAQSGGCSPSANV